MPSLDVVIVVHRLLMIDGHKPVKQRLRRMRSNVLIKLKEEERKQ